MKPRHYKGRGAVTTPAGRFAVTTIEAEEAFSPDDLPETVLKPMKARSIISRNQSPDIGFDQSINPYQGCEHGCVYCYARPGHSYLDLSPGLDFETRIFYKPNALQVLRAEWEKTSYVCKPVAIGANTDPYQPAEKKLGITRQLLEAFLEHRHPVTLITKAGLIERDVDILSELASRNLASVAISVPTMRAGLKRVLEPRVPAASARFRAMRRLSEAGVPVTLLLAPIIPAVNDGEIETIVERAAENGATRAGWILLRLPHELREIFRDWLGEHLPERADHVMSLLRQASGGKDYDNRYGVRQRGRGPYATMIRDRFRAACRRHGINGEHSGRTLDCSQFRPPGRRQMGFAFD